MKIQFFCLKVEAEVLHLQDANFIVSQPINKLEVMTDVINRLHKIDLVLIRDSLRYVIKDNHLYVEGEAYEYVEPATLDFIIS